MSNSSNAVKEVDHPTLTLHLLALGVSDGLTERVPAQVLRVA